MRVASDRYAIPRGIKLTYACRERMSVEPTAAPAPQVIEFAIVVKVV